MPTPREGFFFLVGGEEEGGCLQRFHFFLLLDSCLPVLTNALLRLHVSICVSVFDSS